MKNYTALLLSFCREHNGISEEQIRIGMNLQSVSDAGVKPGFHSPVSFRFAEAMRELH